MKTPAPIPPVQAVFAVTPGRGFLPASDPIQSLPGRLDAWTQIAADLPKLLMADRLRREIDDLEPIGLESPRDPAQLQRAMVLLSYLAHGYVWGSATPASHLPAGLAIPFAQVAQQLGRPPVLSYASYALYNWRRLDSTGSIALGNIALCQNFLGSIDEEWFILVHVEIEARAAAAMRLAQSAQARAAAGEVANLRAALHDLAQSLGGIHATLERMPEHCDPSIYYHRVRPYLYGWKDQPALPDGLIYDGVERFAGKPQKFRGETGAQSSIVPSLDAILGVGHANDMLQQYLAEMRDYMPPPHRDFIRRLEQSAAIRPFVLAHRLAEPALRDAFNECVNWVEKFRSLHLEYAARYIQHQSQRDAANPNDVGTGGTPFMSYLKKHRDETSQGLVA